jgi:hypothetical protein
MAEQTSSAYHKSATATADTPFQVDNDFKVKLSAVNFHVYTNDLYYGNVSGQEGIIRANAVIWFDGTIVVSDWWFKNVTAGSNGKIVIVGVVK